jgi:hypothetical protein
LFLGGHLKGPHVQSWNFIIYWTLLVMDELLKYKYELNLFIHLDASKVCIQVLNVFTNLFCVIKSVQESLHSFILDDTTLYES